MTVNGCLWPLKDAMRYSPMQSGPKDIDVHRDCSPLVCVLSVQPFAPV